MITQPMYSVTRQRARTLHIKINLLNFSYQTIDSLEGLTISGNINMDATSDLRRSCQVKLAIKDSSFDVSAGGKIFLDRYIQIFVGIEHIRTGEIIWFNKGIYLINAPSYVYDGTTNTLTFEGLDLMSKMTGARNGYLIGMTYKIPQGSDVRGAIIAVLNEAGFTRYAVDSIEQTVPYDMTFDQGSTQYSILAALRDILPNYQIYFDEDGVFHYTMIPSGENESVVIDDSTWEKVIISEQINVDFESVKNVIEVFGRTHDVQHYSSSTTLSGSTLNLTIASLTSLAEFIMIGFTPTVNVSGNINLSVNSFGSKSLVDSNGNFVTNLDANTYYVASYQSNGTWLFLGHLQAYATISDTNPESPFYINNDAGEIRIALFGGDYDNIMSDELAQQRCQFELYTRCRLNDTITLSCVPVYYLDVHQLASYTTKNNKATNKYMIQSISMDLDPTGAQTINMSRFYPFYEVI